MERLKDLYYKQREKILYLFFGGITTAINQLAFFLLNKAMHFRTAVIVAWLISVSFAFIVNRIFVFGSKKISSADIFKEAIAFFGTRLVSGAIDLGLMQLLAVTLGSDEVMLNIAKLVSNIIVIIINYITTKFIVFKK